MRIAEEFAKFPPTRRYLIGVSGGRDSVVLLHWLLERGFKRLVVCHLDHGLRGRASRADAAFVGRLAKRRGLPFVTERLDVASLAKQKRQSIETAAREARYDFFSRVARGNKCTALFLAHHADDQVETFLFNLFRGTGGPGLAGMRRVTRRGDLRVIRPLLGVWRSEIDAYAKTHKLKFREDASNRLLLHQRNRMRHRIIPALEKFFGRDIRKSIWRTAEILAAEEDWMNVMTPKPARELSAPALRAMPVALQRRLIRAWLQQMRVSNIRFDAIESVRALLTPAAKQAKVNLPGGRHARRRLKKLFLE